jgi:thymidylate synthase (FAD)
MINTAFIKVNGQPAYQDKEWLKSKLDEGLSINDITELLGCSRSSVAKHVKWYDLGDDISTALKKRFKKQSAWNKGLSGYSINRIFTKEEKLKISKQRSGSNSNFWKGGISSDRQLIASWTTNQAIAVHKKFDYTCQICNIRGGKLEVDHIKSVVEFPKLAMVFDNLQSVHVDCHKKKHFEKADFKKWRNKHNGNTLVPRLVEIIKVEDAGVIPVFDLEMNHSDHNYIANGIIVHNSYNELSRMYTHRDVSFFIPKEIFKNAKSFELRNAEHLDEDIFEDFKRTLRYKSISAFEDYEKMIASGIANEYARAILPQNLVTEFIMTGNLRNWMHFIKLRIDNYNNVEVMNIAKDVGVEIEKICPISYGSLIKHNI